MTTVDVLVAHAGSTRLVGQAHVTRMRSQISTTFLYDPAYLVGDGMNIDPALQLVPGSQHQTDRIAEREITLMAESIEPRLEALVDAGRATT